MAGFAGESPPEFSRVSLLTISLYLTPRRFSQRRFTLCEKRLVLAFTGVSADLYSEADPGNLLSGAKLYEDILLNAKQRHTESRPIPNNCR